MGIEDPEYNDPILSTLTWASREGDSTITDEDEFLSSVVYRTATSCDEQTGFHEFLVEFNYTGSIHGDLTIEVINSGGDEST